VKRDPERTFGGRRIVREACKALRQALNEIRFARYEIVCWLVGYPISTNMHHRCLTSTHNYRLKSGQDRSAERALNGLEHHGGMVSLARLAKMLFVYVLAILK
jgi:hypothetical protein